MKMIDRVHQARGVRADPHGAARARVPVAHDHRGEGLGPAEGDHRALPRLGADDLPAAEDEDRVRRRGQGRADDRRDDPQARPHRVDRRRQGVRPAGRGGVSASAPARPARRSSRRTRTRPRPRRRDVQAARRRAPRAAGSKRPAAPARSGPRPAPAPGLVARLREVHLEMVDAVLAGDGLERVAELAAARGRRAGGDRRAAARATAPGGGAVPDERALEALGATSATRSRGRPAQVPDGVVAEVPIASGDETGRRGAAARAAARKPTRRRRRVPAHRGGRRADRGGGRGGPRRGRAEPARLVPRGAARAAGPRRRRRSCAAPRGSAATSRAAPSCCAPSSTTERPRHVVATIAGEYAGRAGAARMATAASTRCCPPRRRRAPERRWPRARRLADAPAAPRRRSGSRRFYADPAELRARDPGGRAGARRAAPLRRRRRALEDIGTGHLPAALPRARLASRGGAQLLRGHGRAARPLRRPVPHRPGRRRSRPTSSTTAT